MSTHHLRLKAFTLTELMTVLVIIGVLILIALPVFDGIFSDAYSIEAQNQLKYLQSREQTFYQKKFAYSDDLASIGFVQPKTLEEGGDARYHYEIIEAGKSGFKARAVAIVDFDNDGNVNTWEIDQEGTLIEVIPD